MISALQNQAFSLIILTILKKRAKRLTVFDGILICALGKTYEIIKNASDVEKGENRDRSKIIAQAQ